MSATAENIQNQETHQFGAETGKILQLMIHSLYANKDIFLRELISNSSDALDKLRYNALTDKNLRNDDELKIQIIANEDDNTLIISDNGIGMNKQDLINNLGTIASSGTQKFLEAATGDSKKDVQLIGQFGVGFYSSFMVADKVTVISSKAGEDEVWQWKSAADGNYTIEKSTQEFTQGTKIILHLKEESKDFTDKHRITHIIKTYSDHISFPVEFTNSEGETSILNKASALWNKPKNEITDENYNDFYKHISNAGDQPWLTLHSKVEGNLEYTYLLFIPTNKPFDLFHPDRATRVKLYVKKVFISEENNNLVPEYLRFLRGVVDSQDLPLNISRETLQHNNVVHKIKNAITKKVLNELKKKSEKEPEDFQNFWDTFGATIKEGLCEGVDANRELLLDVCHFKTTKSDGKYISLASYIENMQENQEKIYYITADSAEAAQNSPQLEGFLKKGVEVLLLTDSVDDFWVNVNHQYKEKELVSITRSGLDLNEDKKDSDEENQEDATSPELENTINYFKEILGEKVIDVVASKKLSESPVCLTTQEGGMDMRMERFLVSQKQLLKASPKVLEINADNNLIKFIGSNSGSEKAKDLVEILFDQACIIEGETISDINSFTKRFNSFLESAV